MSLLVDDRTVRTSPETGRSGRKRRRALRSLDEVDAALAELFTIETVLADARRVVERGWMQHGWYTYESPSGASVTVTACTPWAVRRLAAGRVTSACLVGAIVHAGGGPSRARSQLVQRTIDLTWHTLFRDTGDPVRWCSSPSGRAGHMIDLVGWNDHPGRRADDVAGLLERASGRVPAEVERRRQRQQELSGLLG